MGPHFRVTPRQCARLGNGSASQRVLDTQKLRCDLGETVEKPAHVTREFFGADIDGGPASSRAFAFGLGVTPSR